MSKHFLTLLSAAIFALYGIVTHKWAFILLGGAFTLMAIAEYLKRQNKLGK
ncbi:hypothetical protein MKL29_04575 [Streptococcus suis]|nr:hypothetical protein [Streptococcus suis]